MAQQLPVYVRLGDDGEEHLLGWVSVAEPAAVLTAVAELFRTAAFTVETDQANQKQGSSE